MHTHNPKLKILLTLLAFLLTATWVLPVSYALEIKVKDQATVENDRVYLGDISSFDPQGDSRVANLSKLEIASAPSPGNSIRLNARFLLYKIGSAIAGDDDIRITAPENLFIQRSAQYMDKNLWEEIFKEHVRSNISWPVDGIEFERITTPGTIPLPKGKLTWEVRGKGNPSYIGNTSIVVNLLVDGKKIRTVSISGRIRVRLEVVKTARKIRKGQLITRDDLITVVESATRRPKDVLTDPNEAIGKRSVRGSQPGRLVSSQMFEDPPLVKKGDRVLIKAENKQIRITTLGKVLEDGRSGDQVRVVNLNSGKEIFATVTGPSQVEVTF